ncbi:hypothetical protein [Mycolicibacterium grossiae]|uniref:hypothetical protein n=1 Tax=Mycolicibacterium grossiae TaxID=1552759 RepID=UPI000F7B0B11|nr:hypothetical protein [Mycolicibacterium grossiae]QEM43991.1 hypothetical protein FZ046_03615 [Mycolicibacterium grossiae]
MAQQPRPLWYDPDVFEGVMAFSFALPYALPLAGYNLLVIEDEYLSQRGASPQDFDHKWMQTPFNCLTRWVIQKTEPNPVLVDSVLASSVLSTLTGHEPPDKPLSDAGTSHDRSVAVVMVPVKTRAAGFAPPHDGKVDPLTVAHWLIADVARSLRIESWAPLPDLHYPALSPIVPVAFGAGPNFDEMQFGGQYALLLDHLPNRLGGGNQHTTNHDTVGQIFGQLTRGSISALIRDHMCRAWAEQVAGDSRASILSSAIACELMLDSVLAAMLWEEGKSVEEAAKIWADHSSITVRVKRLYATRLLGNWSLEGTGPIARWLKHIVYVRNSVIHSGRTPSPSEVNIAGPTSAGITGFVASRLVARWEKYPKTMSVLCGPTSVRQHASKKKQDAILQELERCSPFAVDFHKWRDEWLEARQLI